MTQALKYYIEPLSSGELDFLVRKEAKERGLYYKVFSMLMVVSFIVPYVAAWYRVADGAPNAFSYTKFFVAAGILLVISSVATYVSYRFNLRNLQLDIKERSKTIVLSHITRKMYVASNDTYHFYIDSFIKLSIEVSLPDYQQFKEGDEISLEYSTHAHEYLGYF